jgi:glutamate 5-kinase
VVAVSSAAAHNNEVRRLQISHTKAGAMNCRQPHQNLTQDALAPRFVNRFERISEQVGQIPLTEL